MKQTSFRMLSGLRWGLLCGVVLVTGCQQPTVLEFTSSKEVKELKADLQAKVVEVLQQNCGTAIAPKLLGEERPDNQKMKLGQSVYTKRCVQCHGVSGDGAGPAAASLYPRPRDYRRGIFKFTSTPYGLKPQRGDLERTIRKGVPGTSMPSFELLPKHEIEAVLDYVLMLTHRGELEYQLAEEAKASEELADDSIKDMITLINTQWEDAKAQTVTPLTPEPILTLAHVQSGKQAFLTRGCSKCHGDDGRGQTVENFKGDLKDNWGFPTRAADLTSGLLHGGNRPIDIYRRIHSGINGTPMPGFSTSLAEKPEELWQLVSYVLYVSNRRRAGDVPPVGALTLAELPQPAGAPAAAPPANAKPAAETKK